MINNSRSSLAERINREPLISPDALFDLFARVQYHITDCMRAITQVSPAIALTLLEVGSEVVAKLQRNKSLFRRRVEYSDTDDTLRDATMDQGDEINAFLCECFDLGRDLAAGKDVVHHVENTRLSRMFLERFLRAFIQQAEDYEDATWRMAAAFSPTNVMSDSYVHEASHVVRLRHSLGVDDTLGYGVVRFVRSRIQAIDAIYTSITKAYARVILKVAKGNSIDDDHFLELFQYGFFGLQRANATYDYVLNAKFVAVAKWWVRQSIMYWMKASSGLIRISPSLWQYRARMEQAKQKILARQGDATSEDIAAEMNSSARYVESVYDNVRLAQVGTFDPTLHDTQVVEAEGDSLLSDVSDAVSRLTPKERAWMSLLYGMDSNIQQSIPESDVRKHKLRQRVGFLLIAEA